ncbi:GntR family transcriptional regulator [Kitasatospora sp. A2-31]|uniref:GntR family transcriptional regulator n=1 Tax=Kitasatospora sp. A2-31 TaxID=2916414 RepID=UPI001EE9C516|nr:GntR family transcriptional regulator [Kitasatospora sp. A2-31]MCG6496648.1 GntR family transcriptional regulator [Kitasatospora sp. A2-31]
MAYKTPGKGYADVADHFRKLIKDGELAPGELLPSVAEIRVQFDVAAKTVSRALGVLKSEGLVTSRGSLGTVVAKSPMVITGTDRTARIARNGRQYAPGEDSTDHRVMRRSVHDGDVCQALDLEPGDEVVIRIRTFRQDGRPTSVSLSVYPPRTVAHVPELAAEGRMTAGFFGPLYTERTGREVTEGQRTASARQASQDELDALAIDAPQHVAVAVLVTQVTFHDEEGPVGYWEDVYAPGTKMPVPK